MPIDKKTGTVHVTEEERVKYSAALIQESLKRQRKELVWTKEEISRLQTRYKDLEKEIKQMEKLIKSVPSQAVAASRRGKD